MFSTPCYLCKIVLYFQVKNKNQRHDGRKGKSWSVNNCDMSILEEREDYLKNPYFKGHEYGDFTPFYVTVALCATLGGVLFVLNIVFCWCTRHREYWQNRHTGNRWIQPLWTVLPHKTPPLDLSELEPGRIKYPQTRHEIIQYHDSESQGTTPQPQEYLEMQKRESEI